MILGGSVYSLPLAPFNVVTTVYRWTLTIMTASDAPLTQIEVRVVMNYNGDGKRESFEVVLTSHSFVVAIMRFITRCIHVTILVSQVITGFTCCYQ